MGKGKGKIKVEILTVHRTIAVRPGMLYGSPGQIDVDVCVKCGAVVFDPIQHDTWHRAAEGTGQPTNHEIGSHDDNATQ